MMGQGFFDLFPLFNGFPLHSYISSTSCPLKSLSKNIDYTGRRDGFEILPLTPQTFFWVDTNLRISSS